MITAPGEIDIVIVVLPDTVIREIEKSWRDVLEWRKALEEWQGPRLSDAEQLYEKMSDWRRSGLSDKEIAHIVNRDIRANLAEALAWERYHEEQKRKLGRNFQRRFPDLLVFSKHPDPGAHERARNLLQHSRPRLKASDVDELLAEGLSEIQAGKQAFRSYPPVRPDDIKSRIRYWQSRREAREKTSSKTP